MMIKRSKAYRLSLVHRFNTKNAFLFDDSWYLNQPTLFTQPINLIILRCSIAIVAC